MCVALRDLPDAAVTVRYCAYASSIAATLQASLAFYGPAGGNVSRKAVKTQAKFSTTAIPGIVGAVFIQRVSHSNRTKYEEYITSQGGIARVLGHAVNVLAKP